MNDPIEIIMDQVIRLSLEEQARLLNAITNHVLLRIRLKPESET